jgi:DHA1 family tetracycline resistance protein-like MFS transporter
LGGVAGEFGVRIPFFIAAGLSFINLLFGIFVLPESLKVENRRKFEWKKANPVGALVSLSKYPSILGLIAAYFLVFLAGKSVETVWTYYTMHRFEWSTSDVGWSLALVGILVTIVQGGLIGKAVKSFGQKNTILYGYFFWVTGLVLFGVATQGWMMYAFTVVYCLGGVAGPTIQGVMSNQVPANQQGELQGANASLISITSIIGPPLFTGVFTLFTSDNVPFNLPGISFFLGAVLAIISAIIAFFTLKNYQGQ